MSAPHCPSCRCGKPLGAPERATRLEGVTILVSVLPGAHELTPDDLRAIAYDSGDGVPVFAPGREHPCAYASEISAAGDRVTATLTAAHGGFPEGVFHVVPTLQSMSQSLKRYRIVQCNLVSARGLKTPLGLPFVELAP